MHILSKIIKSNNFVQRMIMNTRFCNMPTKKYEEAVNYINSLQSNSTYIKNVDQANMKHSIYSTTIAQTQKYLLRTGITMEYLDTLPVIHVSGTKGKGSTCAFCESILRHHGYKTGLYSSPHLITLRERIKINGKPLTEDYFAENVIKIYNELSAKKVDSDDMPLYFRFLTIVAFNIFLHEKVDVAVIEVGIGGEYDCTNILRNTQVAGITALGLDHVQMLGSTIQEIAWQKAGIIKPTTKVFTVHQPELAMAVLHQRSIEKNNSIKTVPNFEDYNWHDKKPTLGIEGDVQKENASLAIQLAHCWMSNYGKKKVLSEKSLMIPELTKIGLMECKWPGRFQILKLTNFTFFLDGAHTVESLEKCVEWFDNNSSSTNKVLLFNMIGMREVELLLKILNKIEFNHVLFVPNVAANNYIVKDQEDIKSDVSIQLTKCEQYKSIWTEMQAKKNNKNIQMILVFPSILDAVESIPKNLHYDILVTGSLRLVGAALTLLDPDLKTF